MRALVLLLALAFALAAAMPAMGGSESPGNIEKISTDKPAASGSGPCAPPPCAPPRCGAGVCPHSEIKCPSVIYDMNGNVLLTEADVKTLYLMGNDWLDVAIAANVSKYSSIPITYLLSRIKSGALWSNIVARIGVPPKLAFNVACYPFGQCSIYSQSMQATRLKMVSDFQDTSCPQPCTAPMLNPTQPFRSFYY